MKNKLNPIILYGNGVAERAELPLSDSTLDTLGLQDIAGTHWTSRDTTSVRDVNREMAGQAADIRGPRENADWLMKTYGADPDHDKEAYTSLRFLLRPLRTPGCATGRGVVTLIYLNRLKNQIQEERRHRLIQSQL